jgi:hypothetical protein
MTGGQEEEIGTLALPCYYEWYLYSRADDPKKPGYARIIVTYSWSWLYAPIPALTDTVAIAWSEGPGWASVPNTTTWKYQAWADDGSIYEWSGTDAWSPAVTAKAYSFDIKFTYDGKAITSHSGWLTTTLQAPIPQGRQFGQLAVIGRYFHQVLVANPSITVGDAPSLSISPSICYHWSEGEADLYEFEW